MWEKEDWITYSIDEKEISCVSSIIAHFMEYLLNKSTKPQKNVVISNVKTEINETVDGIARVVILFTKNNTKCAFIANGYKTEEYKKIPTEIWEMFLNMEFAPWRITPYGLDKALEIMRKIEPTETMGSSYCCDECEKEFKSIKNFVQHIRKTNHKDNCVSMFEDFFKTVNPNREEKTT